MWVDEVEFTNLFEVFMNLAVSVNASKILWQCSMKCKLMPLLLWNNYSLFSCVGQFFKSLGTLSVGGVWRMPNDLCCAW